MPFKGWDPLLWHIPLELAKSGTENAASTLGVLGSWSGLIASYLMRAQHLHLLAGRRRTTRHTFTTLNKVNGESHTAFSLLNHSKTCPNRLQSSKNHKLTSQRDHLKQQVSKTHARVLRYVYPPYANNTKDRDKGKQCPSLGGKRPIKTKNTKRHLGFAGISGVPQVSATASEVSREFQLMTSDAHHHYGRRWTSLGPGSYGLKLQMTY